MLGSTVTAKTVHRPEARDYQNGWLVVSNMFFFHNTSTWDNPSHWLSYSSRWLLHHQPDQTGYGAIESKLINLALETTRWGPARNHTKSQFWPNPLGQNCWFLMGGYLRASHHPGFEVSQLQASSPVVRPVVSLGLVKGKLVRKPLHLMGRKHGSHLIFPSNNPLIIIIYILQLNHVKPY